MLKTNKCAKNSTHKERCKHLIHGGLGEGWVDFLIILATTVH